MRWKLHKSLKATLAVLLWCVLESQVHADPAGDQYAVASGHYTRARWQLAAEEFERFVTAYPEDARAAKAIFFQAEALMQAGRPDQAGKAFEKYISAAPRGSFARQAEFRIGEAALLAGDSQQAAMKLREFVAAHPEDPLCAYALPYLGDISLERGDTSKAKEYYEAALERFPKGATRADAQFGFARAQHLAGDLDLSALRTVEATYSRLAAEGNPSVADRALFYLGTLHFQQGKHQAAQDAWQRLEKSFPQSRYREKAQLGQARVDYELKRLDVAEQRLRTLVSTNVAPDAEYWLGMIARARGDHQAAAERFSGAARQHAQHALAPALRYAAAESLIHAEDYSAAITTLVERGDGLDDASSYLLALAHQGAKQHKQAIKVLADLKPNDAKLAADVLAARAHSLYLLEQFNEAAQAHRDYLRLAPEGAVAERSRAELAISLGNLGAHEEALAMLEVLKKQHPGSAWIAVTTDHLAGLARSAGLSAAASKLYTSLGSAPHGEEYAAKALHGLAWSKFTDGQYAEAAAAFERLAKEHPEDPRVAEAIWMKGQCAQRQGDFDAALGIYLQVVERHPDSAACPSAMLAAARLYDRLDQDEAATDLYSRLIEQFPKLPELDDAIYGYAWALRDLGRDDDADAAFQRLHDESPRSELWPDATYRLAERALIAKQFGRAIELLAKLEAAGNARELAPHASYLRAQVYLAQTKWADAELALAATIEQYPEAAFVLQAEYWLAECAYRSERYLEAEQRFERLAKRIVGQSEAWMAMIPLRYAQSLAQSGRWDEAAGVAGRIAAEFPQFQQQYEADYLLGRCHASQGDFQQAREDYGRVISSPRGGKTETAAMAQWMIGETHFHQKNYDAALREYLRVEILYSYPRWQAASLLQAGKCYEHLSQPQAASDLYARLLKNHGQSEFADEAAKRLKTVQQATARRP